MNTPLSQPAPVAAPPTLGSSLSLVACGGRSLLAARPTPTGSCTFSFVDPCEVSQAVTPGCPRPPYSAIPVGD